MTRMRTGLARVGLTMALVASVLVVAPDHAAPAGVVTNYTHPSISDPVDITEADGALWFTNYGGSSIGRITTSGTVTDHPTTLQPYAIATGPDGALWFTNPLSFQIGRLTTSGTETYYPTSGPTSINSAQGIAAGPDGAMWFTNFVGGKIGRITMAGDLTYFDANPLMTDIAAGPDGAMWFTYSYGVIGRITMAGTVSYFSGPGIGSPAGITAGPDGAMWFTNGHPEASSIGRITTSGAVTTYTHPALYVPEGITEGPDGALWFVHNGGGGIGRVTTSGTVTTYGVASGVYPTGSLTFGPDGALWFPGLTGIAKMVLVLGVSTTSVPAGQVQSPYSTTLVASDGTGPYSWSLESGSLPPGLSLSAAGVISGTPTTVGTSPFVVKVTDSDGPPSTATRALSITVGSAAFRITTISLPSASLGVPYSAALQAANGVPPYKWKKLTKMPKGLKFNAKTGTIFGFPKKLTGNFTVTFQAKYKTKAPKQKAVQHYATKSFILTVN